MTLEYDQNKPEPEATETATFALGCFWGPDSQFGAMDGVVRTRVGYAGGTNVDPAYRALGDHTEVFQVDYDPEELTYADLLGVVFDNHTPDHQTGKRQYQNVVFYDSESQREALETYLDANGMDADSIETRIERLDRFYLAEGYHQKYHLKSKQSLLDPFEESSYNDEAIRESPAAAKLNGVAGGHDVPQEDDLDSLLKGTAST